MGLTNATGDSEWVTPIHMSSGKSVDRFHRDRFVRLLAGSKLVFCRVNGRYFTVSSNEGLSNGEKEKAGGGRGAHTQAQLSHVQSGVRAEGSDESDLQSGSVSSKEVQARDVHRSGKPSKQARPRRIDSLSRLGGLLIATRPNETVLIET